MTTNSELNLHVYQGPKLALNFGQVSLHFENLWGKNEIEFNIGK